MSAGIRHKFMDGTSATTGQKKSWARKRQCSRRRKERLAAQAAAKGISVSELQTQLFQETLDIAKRAKATRTFAMPSLPYWREW